jgi:hypothetical protein
MISTLSNSEYEKSTLKVVKNGKRNQKKINGKKNYYINTLIPGFSYMNGKGETVTPRKCAILNM